MVRSKMGAVEEESLYLSHCRERKPLLLLPLSLLLVKMNCILHIKLLLKM